MDIKIKEYRTKHKKCKWCKYYKYNPVKAYMDIDSYYTCDLKDKIIEYSGIPRLCKWYELKEDKNDIQINKSNKS